MGKTSVAVTRSTRALFLFDGSTAPAEETDPQTNDATKTNKRPFVIDFLLIAFRVRPAPSIGLIFSALQTRTYSSLQYMGPFPVNASSALRKR